MTAIEVEDGGDALQVVVADSVVDAIRRRFPGDGLSRPVEDDSI